MHKPVTAKTKLTGVLPIQRSESPFILSFNRKLQNQYRFPDLKQNDLKPLQNLVDEMANKSVQEIDCRFKRETDRNDDEDGEQVYHYGKNGEALRIHGVYYEDRFEVVRIDPKHKYHNH